MNSRAKRQTAIGIALGLILGMGALAGCTGSGAGSAVADSAASGAMDSVPADGGVAAGGELGREMSGSSEAAQSSQGEAPAYDQSAAAGRTGDAGNPVSAAQVTDRQIIRTAEVTLEIPVPPEKDAETGEEKPAGPAALAAAATRAAHAVRALANLPDAYVSGSDGHGATVTITLRIPAGRYDSVMGRLADIGEVTGQSESTTDVTGEMVDVASRLQTMQASVDRLRALMAEATSMTDVIALESELSSREADLESLQRRQAALSDQVALSTISVTVNAVAEQIKAAQVEPAVEKASFIKGLEAGWRGLTAVGRGAAAVIGALLPFLLPLALLGGIAWLATRSVRAKRRAALPAVAAGHPLDVGPDVAEVHHDPDQGS
jgi:hypothetical protein